MPGANRMDESWPSPRMIAAGVALAAYAGGAVLWGVAHRGGGGPRDGEAVPVATAPDPGDGGGAGDARNLGQTVCGAVAVRSSGPEAPAVESHRDEIRPTPSGEADRARPEPSLSCKGPPRANPPDPARAAARAEVGLPPEPVTLRALRDRVRARAAADPAGFAGWAEERLTGSAPQEEKTAILLNAREGDPAAADRLFALALRTSDDAFRETAVQLLLGRCARDPEALRRAYALIVTNDSAPADLRARAAHVTFASLPGNDIERFVADAERRLPLAVVDAALHGLARNPAPRARERLRAAAVGRWWDPELQALAAGDDPVLVAEGE